MEAKLFKSDREIDTLEFGKNRSRTQFGNEIDTIKESLHSVHTNHTFGTELGETKVFFNQV